VERIVEKMEWVVDASAIVLAAMLMGVAAIMLVYAGRDLVELRNFSVGAARSVVLDVLNILVLIELVRMFIKMEREHSFQAVTLVDAGLVFVTREILVSLYDHAQQHLTAQVAIFVVFAVAHVALSRPRVAKPTTTHP
jgi:uncharacterized membrane protein (DUF373 family)